MNREDDDAIPMTVARLATDPYSGLPVVILRDEAGERCVPISVGMKEASAIAAELQRIEVERPMTHQLMGALLESARVRVDRVQIFELVDATFRARIRLHLPCGGTAVQEGRPSDAIALALHSGAPIEVALRVLDAIAARDLRRGCKTPPAGVSEEALVDAFADATSYKWKM